MTGFYTPGVLMMMKNAHPGWPDHWFRPPQRRTRHPGEFMYRSQDAEYLGQTLAHGIAPRYNAGMLPDDPEAAVYLVINDGRWHCRPEDGHPGTPQWRAHHPRGSYWKIDVSGLPLVEDRTYTSPVTGVQRGWMAIARIGPERLRPHEPGSEYGITYDLPGGGTGTWMPEPSGVKAARATAKLAAANAKKQRQAAAEQVMHATAALRLTRPVPAPLAEAARLRVAHPNVSIAELARLASPPVTRAVIAWRLRRLREMAARMAPPRVTGHEDKGRQEAKGKGARP